MTSSPRAWANLRSLGSGPFFSSLLPMDQFIHPLLNERVEFFGGGYLFVEEGRLKYGGEEVLYLKGIASIEASCCGPAGWGFIKVPGYIRSWKMTQSEKGQSISEVEKIESHGQQEEIREILRHNHPGFSQIEFL
jgi:hypothetical protein